MEAREIETIGADNEDLIEKIKEYQSKKLFIITKEFESKIPSILCYLQKEENSITTKKVIVNYLNELIKNIPYNSEIILAIKSDNEKQKMNLYEIIIYQYIYTDKNEKEYIKLLKQLINLILKKLSYNKDVYQNIYSYISNFFNQKLNNSESDNNKFNEYNYYQLLDLILSFYQSSGDDEPLNYFYFNGDPNTYISLDNSKKGLLKLDNNLYFLLFVKLVDYNYISQLIKDNKNQSYSNLLNINFKDKKNNFSINVNYGEETSENANIIGIPYKSFSLKGTNNVLIKLSPNMDVEIYVNCKKIILPSDILKDFNKKNMEVDSIKFFEGFYGFCSTIMIYRDRDNNKMENLYPDYLIEKEINTNMTPSIDKLNISISSFLKNGLYKESYLVPFVKADIKNKMDETNVFDSTLKDMSDKNLDNLNKFINNNLISIYVPIRTLVNSYNQPKKEDEQQTEEENREILLIDSINNFNAKLSNSELYKNLIYGRGGGVRLLSNILTDFSIDINGINHIISLIEIMIDYPELLTKENFRSFMTIILYLFSNHQDIISNEQNPKFFYYLSLFLEKIPEQFYNDLAVNIKSILLTLESLETPNNKNSIYSQEFFNHVCMNEKILFKFSKEDRKLIYEQIYKFLVKQNSEQKRIDIDISNIINILLYHEKNKYTHFCCKKHADYFTKESQIMKPELNEYIKTIIDIIKLLFNQFIIEVGKDNINNLQNFRTRDQLLKLFKLLTFDITPCLQKAILTIFYDFIKKSDEKYYVYLNVDNNINLIILHVFKTSLFDTKELAFIFLNELMSKKSNNNNLLPLYIENFLQYYDYQQMNNKKEESQNIKKSVKINTSNYNLTSLNEGQRNLLSYYDKKHYYELMNSIFDKAAYYFNHNISMDSNFYIPLIISSKGDITFINKFLNLIQEELNKKTNNNIKQINKIYSSQKLFQWLLDTCYQSYLIQKYNFKEEEFTPGFSFGEINDENEKKKQIDNIIKVSNNLILNIICKNIYKLDYLMTWSKYYYEIKEKTKFGTIRDFIFKYIFEIIIKKVSEKTNDGNSSNKFYTHHKLYLINILFEYFTFHKTKCFQLGGELKDENAIFEQVCIPFIYTLLTELAKSAKNENENENLFLLKDKWKEYEIIKDIFSDLEIFGLDEDSIKLNDEKNIYNVFINNKNNIFKDKLKQYFFNIEEFLKKNNIRINCNKGTEFIIIKYHFYTLLLTVITNYSEFREVLNDLRSFILSIIISSTTLSIDYKKSSSSNKPNEEKWPNEEEYKKVQTLVKIILFNILLFLNDKILEIQKKIKLYESKNEEEIIDNYKKINSYLINTMFLFLGLLNTIYSEANKQELDKKNNTGYFKGLYAKIKSKIVSDKEGIQLTGGYLFIKEFITTCLIEKKLIENEIPNSEESILKEKTFLDDIPSFSSNSINEKDYLSSSLHSKLEKLYLDNYNKNQKIPNYFTEKREIFQKSLFPFIDYILKRNQLICTIIPIYDNSVYVKNDYSYLCLKPNYIPELSDKNIKMENITKFSQNLIDEIRMYQIKMNYKSQDKIRGYRKIKKKLFSFNGLLSTKKYFYEKNKYICKYRLLNHMTEDFTKIFLTPIIDMNYYLPKFSKFEIKNLFRDENKDHLIQITELSDLTLKQLTQEEDKKKEDIEVSNFNALYLLKESEFKYMNSLNSEIEGSFNHYLLYKEFINNRHNISSSYHNNLENSCLVKAAQHIRGFFYSNKNEIGFYSYDKIPYPHKKGKNKNANEVIDKRIQEIQKDYDPDRKSCFGSIFSPQNEKYEYFHFYIPYNEIVFILKRRYYFKISALEIFTTDKKSYLFKFDHSKFEDILTNIKHYINPKSRDIYIENSKFYDKIGFLNESSRINNMNKKIYEKNYMNLKTLYDKWKKWEISTMRLLMYLNIYANRSFNDINQYPVFPWIIIDYKSEKFPKNITSTEVARPLNTPMGMLEINEDAKQRKEDYLNHWEISKDDDDREDEFDRYGSHYSTSLYVSYYLVRIFPFAYIRIELQGTNFDDPNRLFNSMRASFDCSSTQKADLRELIPELFCFPEILLNNNDFNLGEIKDNSESNQKSKEIKMKLIQEVETPKWCENNAFLFIKKHRELLESYEIGNNLNEWINLIFGSKQKGSAANNAKNLYNLQTYEDYEKTFDDMEPEDKEISCRMLEFGVTPHQIFKNDASQRKINLDKVKKQLFFKAIENYNKNDIQNEQKEKENLKNNYLVYEDIKGDIHFTNPERIFYFPKDKNSDNNKKNIYIMNISNLNIYLRKTDKEVILIENENNNQFLADVYGGELGNEKYDEIIYKKIEKKESVGLVNFRYGMNFNQPYIWLDKGTIIAKGGYWNGNIILYKIVKESNEEKKRISIYTSSEYSPIIKIVVDKNETFAICGNTNGTIFVYKIFENNKMIWTLYKSFNDNNSSIASIAIHENLNIAITCFQNGLCMLYTVPDFKLYNSFILGKDDKENKNEEEVLYPDIVLISDSSLPCFVFYVNFKKTLYFYSINGYFLQKHELKYSIKENNIKIYKDFQFIDYLIIYNSMDKTIDLYTMVDFKRIHQSPVLPKDEDNKNKEINYDFVDFALSDDNEHCLVLCKNDKNNIYKIYMLKDSKVETTWK